MLALACAQHASVAASPLFVPLGHFRKELVHHPVLSDYVARRPPRLHRTLRDAASQGGSAMQRSMCSFGSSGHIRYGSDEPEQFLNAVAEASARPGTYRIAVSRKI